MLPRTIYFVEIKILIIQGCRQNRYSEDKLHIDQEKVSLGHTLGHKDRPSKPHNQGPVVQSIVSLTSSLRIISLTVLADSVYNILIFFAEKM